MKSTGIVRRVDQLGRIVLPKELRRTFEISEGDPLEIYVDGNTVVLKKYEPGCVFCGETNGTVELNGKHVCKACADRLYRGADL